MLKKKPATLKAFESDVQWVTGMLMTLLRFLVFFFFLSNLSLKKKSSWECALHVVLPTLQSLMSGSLISNWLPVDLNKNMLNLGDY